MASCVAFDWYRRRVDKNDCDLNLFIFNVFRKKYKETIRQNIIII